MEFKTLDLCHSQLKNVVLDLFCTRKFSSPLFDINNGPWIAGGAARLLLEGKDDIGESDIDVFFSSKEQMECFVQKWITELKNNRTTFTQVATDIEILSEYTSRFSRTFEIKYNTDVYSIQLITNFQYRNIEDMFSHFDYSITFVATDLVSVVTTKQTLYDLKNKILDLGDQGYIGINSYSRLVKYIRYGYKPKLGIIPKILEHINHFANGDLECEWEDYE